MAIKAKKDQIAILRPLFEKTVKIRPLLIPNIPPIIYKKWPYFFKMSPPSPIFRKEGHSKIQIFGRKAIIRARNV